LSSNRETAKLLGKGTAAPRRRARHAPLTAFARRPSLASAPRVARGPADRGRHIPKRPRPDAPWGQPRACRLAVALYPRRAPGGPPVRPARRRTCVGRSAAVPRRYLRRQHAVTAERLFKVAARSCVCHAEPPPFLPHHRVRHCRPLGETPLRLHPELSTCPNRLLRTCSGLPSHPLPGIEPLLTGTAAAVATTVGHRRAPSPEPRPRRPTPSINPR
jgi:hypothetical protein